MFIIININPPSIPHQSPINPGPSHDSTEVHGTHGVLQTGGHCCPVRCCLAPPRSWLSFGSGGRGPRFFQRFLPQKRFTKNFESIKFLWWWWWLTNPCTYSIFEVWNFWTLGEHWCGAFPLKGAGQRSRNWFDGEDTLNILWPKWCCSEESSPKCSKCFEDMG